MIMWHEMSSADLQGTIKNKHFKLRHFKMVERDWHIYGPLKLVLPMRDLCKNLFYEISWVLYRVQNLIVSRDPGHPAEDYQVLYP